MVPPNETFDGTFPFKPQFTEAAGFRMHYVDEGAGDPIVCLHGEPTWGYLYRNFIPPLSETHRVIVPDHMGFGKSETPQDREYTLRTHAENLTKLLVETLDLGAITFVGQDWGGPLAAAFTVRNPDRVKRLCLMNTMCGYGRLAGGWTKENRPPSVRGSNWFTWVARALEDGSYHEVMGNLGTTLLSVMKILGFHNSAAVDDTWIRAYTAPFPTRQECLGAIEFPLDVAKNRIVPFVMEGASGVDELRKKPAMLADGLLDRAMPPELVMADFKALFPRGPIVKLSRAGHFCQEDAPETLVALIQQFIQMTA